MTPAPLAYTQDGAAAATGYTVGSPTQLTDLRDALGADA